MRRLFFCRVILAALLTAQFVCAQTAPFFDVKRYGATGNGASLDTAAINKAIDAAAAAGGGTVFFPAGTYLSGTVRLKDNVALFLDSGATLMGSKNLGHYASGVDGQEWYGALILAKGVRNVGVLGRGTIDGNRVFNPKGEERMRGPHALLFHDCRKVTVRDVSFKDAGNYAVILRACEEVNIDGITVRGGWDGINMHDTRNATISNCRLFTGDDSLAGAYWENVTVSNCILNSSANAIRVGGRNVLIANSIIYGPGEAEHGTSLRHRLESGFQILPHRAIPAGRNPNKYVAPGPVDNMVLSNVTMINTSTPIFVAYSGDAPYSANNLGVGRIIVNGLTVLGAGKTPIYISAPAENPAKSIILNNVRITSVGGGDEAQAQGQGFSPFSVLQAYGVYCRNVANLEMHDVRIDSQQPDLRAVLFGENIGTLEIDRFQPPPQAGAPPFLQAAGIKRLTVDGKEAAAARARVTALTVPSGELFAGEPFQVTVAVESVGAEGLASVPLRLGNQSIPRSVWLKAGEKAELRFLNLRYKEPGKVQAAAGQMTKQFLVLPAAEDRPVGRPYQVFQNTAAEFRQSGSAFYIRAGGDYPVMQYGDQYATIYLAGGLPSVGAVVVKLANPDQRTHWVGRVGIMARRNITKPDQSAGYLVLGSSPAAGSYLEWDSDGNGRLDHHTEFEGYTLWPHWLKLERRGSLFTGYSSTDGATWIKLGAAEVPGTEDALDVGMFAYRSSARFEVFRIEK
jgi:hypothetical protein